MHVASLVRVIVCAFAVAAASACDKGEDAKDGKGKVEEKKGAPKDTAPRAETKDAPKSDAPAASGDEIGVPECDAFIEKYARCIAEKVPEAGRAGAQTAMDAMIKGFRDAANGPGRDQLAATCKASEDATKQSMSAMGCTW